MDENKKDLIPPAQELPQEDVPILFPAEPMPEPDVPVLEPVILAREEPDAPPMLATEDMPVLEPANLIQEENDMSPMLAPEDMPALEPVFLPREESDAFSMLSAEDISAETADEDPVPVTGIQEVGTTEQLDAISQWLSGREDARMAEEDEIARKWSLDPDAQEDYFTPVEAEITPETPDESPVWVYTPRKGRPKRKKGYGFFGLPHLLATVVWLAIIVAIGTSLGRMLWVCAADVLAFGRESKKVSITITSNDTIDDIAHKLQDAELIRYPEVFKLYAKLAVDEGDIIPGTFEMDTLYDYHALVVQMGPRSSNRAVVEDVLIPEGMNCRQIFELLEQKNVCTVAELEEYAANGEFADFWFLEGVERGEKYCLEGYLFPDTYDFYANSTPREALGKMLLGFEARFTEDLQAQIPGLNERLSNMMRANGCSDEYIADHQLTLRDVLIVASLIEEETASSKESAIIASVIFNRLTQDQAYERYLNIDAAIIYATGDANNIDTSLDDPYNTYLYPGLTPGPISNPGLDSINAVLNFAETDYYYYVLNPETDMHQFSKTLEEHEKWVEEFKNYDGGDEA